MKTVKELLETLPDGYRERAIANATKNGTLNTRTIGSRLDEAIHYACLQDINPPEGKPFWKAVFTYYANPLPVLPPLPKEIC